MSLAAALEALDRGDDDRALVAALAAWQACRHPRIASVIEMISARAVRERSPPKGKGSVEAKQNAWLAYAADRNPSDIDNLLATLRNVGKAELLLARLEQLRERIDPRIAKAMHALLEDPPISSAAGTPVLNAAMELVVAIADPRSADAWSRLVRKIGDRGGAAAITGLRPKMPSASTRLRAALEDVCTELTDEAAAQLDAIEAKLTPARAAEVASLFAAVYASPDDDQPRIVLADLLQQLGDPRGELIALQLARTGKPSKREKELLDAHAHAWLGDLAQIVERDGLGYERGFVAKCRVDSNGLPRTSSVADRPEWRTVTDLDLSAWRREPRELIDAMPALRVLRGVAIPSSIPPHDRIERVQTAPISSVDELASLAGLPALRALEIDGCWIDPEVFSELWRSPAFARLTEFAVRATPNWLAILVELDIARVQYMSPRGNWILRFENDAIEIVERVRGSAQSELAGLLAGIPTPRSKRVVFATKLAPDLGLQETLRSFADYTLPG